MPPKVDNVVNLGTETAVDHDIDTSTNRKSLAEGGSVGQFAQGVVLDILGNEPFRQINEHNAKVLRENGNEASISESQYTNADLLNDLQGKPSRRLTKDSSTGPTTEQFVRFAAQSLSTKIGSELKQIDSQAQFQLKNPAEARSDELRQASQFQTNKQQEVADTRGKILGDLKDAIKARLTSGQRYHHVWHTENFSNTQMFEELDRMTTVEELLNSHNAMAVYANKVTTEVLTSPK